MTQNLFSTSGIVLLLGSAFIQYRLDVLSAKISTGNQCISPEMREDILVKNKKIRKEKFSTWIALAIGTIITIFGNQIFYILTH